MQQETRCVGSCLRATGRGSPGSSRRLETSTTEPAFQTGFSSTGGRALPGNPCRLAMVLPPSPAARPLFWYEPPERPHESSTGALPGERQGWLAAHSPLGVGYVQNRAGSVSQRLLHLAAVGVRVVVGAEVVPTVAWARIRNMGMWVWLMSGHVRNCWPGEFGLLKWLFPLFFLIAAGSQAYHTNVGWACATRVHT